MHAGMSENTTERSQRGSGGADRAVSLSKADEKGAPADSLCLQGLDMREINDALILCGSLQQPRRPYWSH